MHGPARHLRHGRGHDQRAGMGLLPAGARTWHLPAHAPRWRGRGPGHPVAVGRAGTPQGRTGASMTVKGAGPGGTGGGSPPCGKEAGGVTGTADDGIRLHRLLGDEHTAWLVLRARDRLEAGRSLTGTVTLAGATVEQRRAVERLTGRPPRSGTSLSVSL